MSRRAQHGVSKGFFQHQLSKLKKSARELYRALDLLKNFRILNYTGSSPFSSLGFLFPFLVAFILSLFGFVSLLLAPSLL